MKMAKPDALWNLGSAPKPIEGLPVANDDFEVVIEGDDEAAEDGVIVNEDGSVVINFNADASVLDDEEDTSVDPDKFNENLALKLTDQELGTIAEELLEGIDSDIASRAEWLATRARGLDLLGVKLEEARGSVGNTSAPVEGMSVVRHPLLLKAVLMAWSNARAELLPAAGPAKVVDEGNRSPAGDQLAETLEKDFNFYLTKRAKEYYPDTDRMLLLTCFGGSGFKKIYSDPMRRRPVSESIDAEDLIVNNSATDIDNAGRVTHRSMMRKSVMKRMQILGAYRNITLTEPTPQPDQLREKEGAIEGVQVVNNRPEDNEHTIYETYAEIDIPRFAPQQFKGKGLPLPYRVTIDKDSRQILEIRRNWNYDDPDCMPKTTFVHYTYIRGFGFYGWGLLHLLGNSTSALTAAWREALDAGMFANFPGFLIAKIAARQQTNELRVPAGSGQIIDTQGKPIGDVVKELPYRDVTAGLLGMIDKVEKGSEQIASTVELKVGEGRQDVPVGTMIAQVEQATKIESAIHKNFHQAQSEEFELLAELFREDPESFWRGKRKKPSQWSREQFIAALDTYGITPVSDPNVPSHIHRVMKAMALKQLQAASPQMYDPKAVDTQILKVIGYDNPDALFAPPTPAAPPPIDPQVIVAEMMKQIEQMKQENAKAIKELDSQTKLILEKMRAEEKAKDRELKREGMVADIAVKLAENPDSEEVVDRTFTKDIP
jgi:hypothetical protein